jgi:adenylate cyclase
MGDSNDINRVYENMKSRRRIEDLRDSSKPQEPAEQGGEHLVEFDPYNGTYTAVDSARKKMTSIADPKSSRLAHFATTIADEIYETLVADDERITQLSRGVQEKITVIFADIRGFAYLCSVLPPDRAFSLLNIFHSEMIRIIRDEHGGYVASIMGDCIMSFFGIPYSCDCSIRAVKTAVAMQQQMAGVNKILGEAGLQPIEIGIGINTAIVHAGFITTDRSINGFTVIGEAVNVAALLENIAGPGQIVVGEITRDEILGQFDTRELLEKVTVRGGAGRTKTYSGFLIL